MDDRRTAPGRRDERGRIVETETEARQARTTGRVRYVLLIGMILVVIAFAVVWLAAS